MAQARVMVQVQDMAHVLMVRLQVIMVVHAILARHQVTRHLLQRHNNLHGNSGMNKKALVMRVFLCCSNFSKNSVFIGCVAYVINNVRAFLQTVFSLDRNYYLIIE